MISVYHIQNMQIYESIIKILSRAEFLNFVVITKRCCVALTTTVPALLKMIDNLLSNGVANFLSLGRNYLFLSYFRSIIQLGEY